MRGVKRRLAAGAAALAIVGGLCATVAPTASAAEDSGVTADAVKLGFVFSKTGVASSTFADSDKGCEARVARENAKGGVNGREVQVEYGDDQSSPATNQTVVQDLVQNKDVFMVMNDSSFAFATYRYLLDNDVPMIGPGFDGLYYGEPGNESILSIFGNVVNQPGVVWDGVPKVMKKRGATKVASVGYGFSPSSSLAAKNFNDLAVPAVGLDPVYTNTSVDFGSTDVSPVVLGIKNSGANAVYLPMVASTNTAVVQGLAQNGVKMKATVLATGYGQAFLDEPATQQFGPEVLLVAGVAPVELETKASKQFVSDLKKYADYTEIPDLGVYTGYLSCDMAILGLKHAGKTPKRSAFSPNLRKLATYDQAGLACAPVDISLEGFGKPGEDQCFWTLQVEDGKFVPYPASGKPWRGKLIQKSTEATTTTTTAAP
jgi:branched-chain amino acid transport system substrate-binding protein